MSENQPVVFTFSINWKVTFASVIFLPILIGLGLWQQSRAEEKQTILDDWYIQQALPPITVEKLSDVPSINTPIKLKGDFDQARYWLFENRFFGGKLGYEVLMVFTTTGGERILVNRGWVPASPYRDEWPLVKTPPAQTLVQGVLKDPADFNMLEDIGEMSSTWPKRIVEIDLERMATLYGSTLHPRLLKLNAESLGALAVNNDSPINMTPTKHRAYAFQWFALALALCVLWLTANSNIIQVFKRT